MTNFAGGGCRSRSRRCRSGRDSHGIVHQLSPKGLHVIRPGRTEQQRLAPSVSGRCVRHDSADRTLETHAEHAIGLVDDEHTTAALVRRAAVASSCRIAR